MSVPKGHDEPAFTRAGLAADFGISERTVEHYIACGHVTGVPPALGKHPNGFNYGITHYRAIAAWRATLAERTPMIRRRRHHPHTIKVTQRDAAA
jgi:hypothetical protein